MNSVRGDRACVSCHNETRPELIYLKGDRRITDWSSKIAGASNISYGGDFSLSYASLHRYVRRPGLESDLDMLVPMDVHADQTELMQIVQKGHHNVKLLPEEIEKLSCWIDLNAPFHGRRSDISTWENTEVSRKLRAKYEPMFNVTKPDPEELPPIPAGIIPHHPGKRDIDRGVDSIPGWPVERMAVEHRHGYQFGRKGYPLNHPDQPVVRVSWQEAMEFCRWLSEKTGMNFTLPTEAQWEWTRSSYKPYPYSDNDGRNDLAPDDKKVARGGSWYDRPHRGTSSYRLPYRPYQKVFNVGFRVVMEE